MRFSRPVASTITVLAFVLLASPAVAGQTPSRDTAREVPPAVQTRDRANVTAVTTLDAEETRRQLEDVLKAYPPSLPRILRMDPTLLNNDVYLQPYPALAAFLTQHPEIKHNPQFFLAQYGSDGGQYYRSTPQDRAIDMWRSTIENLTIGTVILAIASGVIWLVKTLIDHRRWSRLSKVQTEVHTKLLDRFSSNEDLLAYIQTPAGRKFLESAPINISAPQAMSAPLGRILWSAQAGAVLTVLGLGVVLVSRTAIEEVAPPLAAMGAIVIALGIGFLVSAFLAYNLTRRFGLMTGPDATPEARG